MDSDELLTSKDVARILKIEPGAVRRYANDGKFPNAIRLGGSRNILRIPRSDVLALIERARG